MFSTLIKALRVIFVPLLVSFLLLPLFSFRIFTEGGLEQMSLMVERGYFIDIFILPMISLPLLFIGEFVFPLFYVVLAIIGFNFSLLKMFKGNYHWGICFVYIVSWFLYLWAGAGLFGARFI